MALSFLTGQCLIALLPRLSDEACFWLLFLPLLLFLRSWAWLGFGLGCLWQFY